MPAKAGIQSRAGVAAVRLDTGFRRYDVHEEAAFDGMDRMNDFCGFTDAVLP